MYGDLTGYLTIDNLILPQTLAASGTTDSSVFYSLKNYPNAEVVVTTSVTSGATATVTVLKASDAAGTGKAVTAATSTATAPASARLDTVHEIAVDKADIDANNSFIGVRVAISAEDAAAKIGAILIRANGRYNGAS